MAGLNTGRTALIRDARLVERRDLVVWLMLVAAGLGLAASAVALDADLGSNAVPFLGRYRLDLAPTALLAPIVAVVTLMVALQPFAARLRWRAVLGLSYLASFAWMTSLAVMSGTDGLTRYLSDQDGYRPQLDGITSVGELLATFAQPSGQYSTAVTGHPPGSVLLLWALKSTALGDAEIGLVSVAVSSLVVPLVLVAARSACGPVAARRYAPLLILAPWAIWSAVGPDGATAVLAAAALASAAKASHRRTRGGKAAVWAVVSGLLLASATMFAYIVAWFGLSIVCLYFARRRPWHNLATGLGALIPLALVQLAGFNWADGLSVAYEGYLARIQFDRSLLWWIPLSLVVLVLACGPAIVASTRKMRNTPAWPFLIGSAVAVIFSIGMGIARGGVEETWLPLFPWLAIAATAPARPGGPPLPTPILLAATGAITALVIETLLISPW